ncbi:MAG: hypothetical protein HY056_09500 [Proteobacteria bacterium]|nr:hypothetical protein [Pseudomonadota bacterium]
MADFVISGASGFIGGRLMAAFAAAGLTAKTYDEFRAESGRAGSFVHCANIHDSAQANAIYTADILATVAGRIDRFVQLQTFATLHGPGQFAAAAINCGKAPLLLAPYAFGKLLQEAVLCREAARYPRLAVRLIYLPAVIGGGSWGHALAQARASGVILPPLMRRAARANHLRVEEIAAYLAGTRNDDAPGTRRAILNNDDARELTWQRFFGDARSLATDNSPRALLKLMATNAALGAYRILGAIRSPAVAAGQPDRRPPRNRAPAPMPQRPPAGPLHFSGLIEHIVRTQPFIAPTVVR